MKAFDKAKAKSLLAETGKLLGLLAVIFSAIGLIVYATEPAVFVAWYKAAMTVYSLIVFIAVNKWLRHRYDG